MRPGRRHFLAAILALGLTPRAAMAEATTGVMEGLVPAARRVGKARFKVIFFKIYDAELFAPDGRFDRAGPYALRLTYLVNGKKDRIVSQTVKEMKRQGSASTAQIGRWEGLMERYFIDMDKGTSADFIHTADGRLVLTAKGRMLGEITDRDFIAALMDIWLGPKVRDKNFQRALLGQGD
ncbi:MAG: chalcone isomerase family protein [Candidatus Puniceispirillaceae bacterium]